MQMQLRAELGADRAAVSQLLTAAFPSAGEARLVERLRAEGAVYAAYVAIERGEVIGYALFSRAHLELPSGRIDVGALGPVAVAADWRRRGIGAALVQAGLERSWQLQLPGVIVLGHPSYYARFGFVRADTWSIGCEFDAPAEAFMIAWREAAMQGPGVAKYHAAFDDV